jgi:tetratricopeptide (TPR) repeat protein
MPGVEPHNRALDHDPVSIRLPLHRAPSRRYKCAKVYSAVSVPAEKFKSPRYRSELSPAFRDRGAAYYFNKDYERAIKDYDEAIKLDLRSDRAYSNRSAAYKKLGRNEQAITDESEAIKLEPSEPAYFDNRGLSYAAEDDYDRLIID